MDWSKVALCLVFLIAYGVFLTLNQLRPTRRLVPRSQRVLEILEVTHKLSVLRERLDALDVQIASVRARIGHRRRDL